MILVKVDGEELGVSFAFRLTRPLGLRLRVAIHLLGIRLHCLSANSSSRTGVRAAKLLDEIAVSPLPFG